MHANTVSFALTYVVVVSDGQGGADFEVLGGLRGGGLVVVGRVVVGELVVFHALRVVAAVRALVVVVKLFLVLTGKREAGGNRPRPVSIVSQRLARCS